MFRQIVCLKIVSARIGHENCETMPAGRDTLVKPFQKASTWGISDPEAVERMDISITWLKQMTRAIRDKIEDFFAA